MPSLENDALTNHSAAPWRASYHRSPAQILSADGECIGEVFLTDLKSRKRDQVHLNNARLMLAAPELGKALKEIQSLLYAAKFETAHKSVLACLAIASIALSPVECLIGNSLER